MNYMALGIFITTPNLILLPVNVLYTGLISPLGAGVIFRNGEPWQTLRRFLLRHLRDMGMGKSRLDDVIVLEAEELIKDLRSYANKPTFFPPSINIAILNIIWQLVASKYRRRRKDEKS